jgi:tetratricopeptide (TPR) repeat protein
VFLASGELALDKGDYALAARTFQEGLKVLPDDADLHWGLARAYAPSDTAAMLAAIESALKHNSNHIGSLLLLTDQRVDEENFAAADQLLERIHAINPWHPEAWAYAAVVAHLREQPERERAARERALRFWTNNPHVDFRIAEKLSRNYRFAEGAAAQRRALAFDPDFLPARAQLGQDLLRLGQDAEGWRLVAEVQQRDGYDVTANNLVKLRDVLDRFTTLTNDHFVVRMGAKEAALYGERVLALLERARERMARRYGLDLSEPVLIEIFPEQKDFAVRTFGLPGYHGYLGVCFGHVITANSPAARPGSNFNWESMLWHEFVHAVTLRLTRNKMPRWLSEGISVYEERLANPAWGERMKPRYRELILEGDLHPVGELSAAFMSPPSAEHLQFAYYQSSLVVEFIVERFGLESLLAILRDLGEGVFINDALARRTAPLAALEKDFAEFARQTARAWAPGLDWEKPPLAALLPGAPAALWEAWAGSRPTNYYVLTRQIREALAAERWPEARAELERLIAAHPEATGGDSPYRQLAAVHRALGDLAGEREALARLAGRDDEAVDAYLRLMELGRDQGDWPTVRENAHRYLAVNPLVPAPYRFLAAAGEATGDSATAIAAYRALLQLDPANPAEIHFGLARQLHRVGDPAARRHVLQALEDAPRHRAALRLLLELHADASAQEVAGEGGGAGGAP